MDVLTDMNKGDRGRKMVKMPEGPFFLCKNLPVGDFLSR
jgi:hypothetical protein